MNIQNSFLRNVLGNAVEGMETGAIAGMANGMGNQFIEKGFKKEWDWEMVINNMLFGMAVGSTMGAVNGVITEEIYQAELKNGYNTFRNSDVAEALGERAGDITANLEATSLTNLWPWGHNYANIVKELPGSICIGVTTGRCTITIDPYSPMVPTEPTYYAPKP